jgi:hypothetical protein
LTILADIHGVVEVQPPQRHERNLVLVSGHFSQNGFHD